MKRRLIPVTQFKTHCLTLLDEIDQDGGTIVVTKRGRPVAMVGPTPRRARKSLEGIWSGKVQLPEDLVTADRSTLWEVAQVD